MNRNPFVRDFLRRWWWGWLFYASLFGLASGVLGMPMGFIVQVLALMTVPIDMQRGVFRIFALMPMRQPALRRGIWWVVAGLPFLWLGVCGTVGWGIAELWWAEPKGVAALGAVWFGSLIGLGLAALCVLGWTVPSPWRIVAVVQTFLMFSAMILITPLLKWVPREFSDWNITHLAAGVACGLLAWWSWRRAPRIECDKMIWRPHEKTEPVTAGRQQTGNISHEEYPFGGRLKGLPQWLLRDTLIAAGFSLSIVSGVVVIWLLFGLLGMRDDSKGFICAFVLLGNALVPASLSLRAGRTLPMTTIQLMMAALVVPVSIALVGAIVVACVYPASWQPVAAGFWLPFLLGAGCLLRTGLIASSIRAGLLMGILASLVAFGLFFFAGPIGTLFIGVCYLVMALVWLRWLLTRSTAPFSGANFFAQRARQWSKQGT